MIKKCLYATIAILVAISICATFLLAKLNVDFFIINFSDYITSVCAIIELLFIAYISYFLTEKKNDERVIKEKINNELNFISISVNKLDEHFFNECFSIKDYTFLKKKIDRSIKIVENFKDRFNYSNELDKIKFEFESINHYISNHIETIKDNLKLLEDLDLHKDRIDNEISNIFLKLFK